MVDLTRSFEWFAEPDGRGSVKPGQVLDDLQNVWQEVRAKVGEASFDSVLSPIQPSESFTRNDDHAWVRTHGDKDESHVNLTLEIDASELTLNLVGFFDGQYDKVRTWVGKTPGRKFLKAHKDLSLVVFVRTAPLGKGNKPMWPGATSEELQRIDLGVEPPSHIPLTLTTLKKQIDPQNQKLALHIRRSWAREEAMGLADVSPIADLVSDWIGAIGSVEVGDQPTSW